MFTDWTKQEWRNFAEGCLVVIASFAFFRILQFIVRWYLFGKCTFRTFSYFRRRTGSERNGRDSTTLSVVPPNKKWRICNETISLIHAGVSGLWAGYAILFHEEIIKDMFYYRHPMIVNLVFVSTGYLLHDLLDLLINERSVRIIELLFHHIVVLTAFAITQFSEKFLGVVVFGLLMECNSVFLHSRSLLNLYGVDKKSTSFRMVALLNMITLLVFRMAVSLFLVYWLFTVCFGTGVWYYIVPSFFVIISLLCSNTVLAYRVMAADGWFGKKRARGFTRGVQDNQGVDEDKSESDEEEECPDGVVASHTNQQLVGNGHTTNPSEA